VGLATGFQKPPGHFWLRVLQTPADDVDEFGRQTREVAERLLIDRPAFTGGSAKQMGFTNAILVDASGSGHANEIVSGWQF
jgi:hypothetical protein